LQRRITEVMVKPVSRIVQAVHHLSGGFKPEIWIATAVFMLTVMGLSISMPFLALYLNQQRGLPMSLVGTIFLVGGLSSMVTGMAGGLLSDRLGRRYLILSSMGISAFLYMGLAALVGVSAPVWAIAVIYIAGRSVQWALWPILSALITDIAPKNRLTRAYGLLRVGGNVGWAVGPALGGYLATFVPYAYLFGVAALTSLITLWISWLSFKKLPVGEVEELRFSSVSSLAADHTFLLFTVFSLLIFIVVGQLTSTLSVFTVDRLGFSTVQYGLLLTLNGLIVVAFQYPVTVGIERMGQSKSLIFGSLLYGLGYLSLGWVGSFGWALGAMAIITCGEILFSPTSLAVVGALAPKELRGSYMGFFGVSQTLGISLGPLVGGILLDSFPNDARFVWGPIAFAALAAALGFYFWHPPEEGKQKKYHPN